MPQLTWLGDEKARRAARRVPYRLLETVQSVGGAQIENLLIQGDSLEALKRPLPLDAGGWPCISIEPRLRLARPTSASMSQRKAEGAKRCPPSMI